MLFSSFEFIFAFLPITVSVYFLLSKFKNPFPQRIFLLAASLFFYAYFEWSYVFIIAASVIFNFITAKLSLNSDSKKAKKLLLILSVIFNVALIGYYKYYDFAIETVNTIISSDFNIKGILIPLGISFFTFQQLSFQVKTYRSTDKTLNFINYALFVTFFPQLIAGPIVLYEDLVPQIINDKNRFFNSENLAKGFSIFTVGLFKKLIIADSLSVIVDNGFSSQSDLGLLPAWICAFAYAFQIYFDFCGYSEMAIGLSKIFNFDLPVNFETPYRSYSIADFWKRWHITLGRCLSALIYIPLGGNKKGKLRKCINLFITFLVSGIWHGASWTFIIWGVLHGVARVLEEVAYTPLSKIPKRIRQFLTFLFAALAFVIFRAETVEQSLHVYRGLINFSDFGLGQMPHIMADGIIGLPTAVSVIFAVAITAFCLIVVMTEKGSGKLTKNFTLTPKKAIVCSILFVISVLGLSRGAVFIYFNF